MRTTRVDRVERRTYIGQLVSMKTIFVIMMFSTFEGLPAGEQVFGEFFKTRTACEAKLMELARSLGGNIKRDYGTLRVFKDAYAEYNTYEKCVELVTK